MFELTVVPGKCYSAPQFNGGSVMVWVVLRHMKEPFLIVDDNLTGIRYRDEITRQYVITVIHNNQRHVTLQQ